LKNKNDKKSDLMENIEKQKERVNEKSLKNFNSSFKNKEN
jgi:hypothetical protein